MSNRPNPWAQREPTPARTHNAWGRPIEQTTTAAVEADNGDLVRTYVNPWGRVIEVRQTRAEQALEAERRGVLITSQIAEEHRRSSGCTEAEAARFAGAVAAHLKAETPTPADYLARLEQQRVYESGRRGMAKTAPPPASSRTVAVREVVPPKTQPLQIERQQRWQRLAEAGLAEEVHYISPDGSVAVFRNGKPVTDESAGTARPNPWGSSTVKGA